MMTKFCPGCDSDVCAETGFHKNKYAKDGLQGWCKVCRANMAYPLRKKETIFGFQPLVVEASADVGILPFGQVNELMMRG